LGAEVLDDVEGAGSDGACGAEDGDALGGGHGGGGIMRVGGIGDKEGDKEGTMVRGGKAGEDACTTRRGHVTLLRAVPDHAVDTCRYPRRRC
jgi:hypothetical protein